MIALADAAFNETISTDDESDEDSDDELPMYEEADDELMADSSNSDLDTDSDNSSEEGHV